MKRGKNNFLALLYILTLSGLLIAANQAFGTDQGSDEEYDEETYGPAERIEFHHPANQTFFDHPVHTLGMGLECDSCHDDLFEMETGAALAKGDFTMKSLAEGKYCGACHDGDTAFDVNSNCSSCHTAPKDTIYFTKPVMAVIFDHTTHTGMGIGCEECHKEFFKMKLGDAETEADFTMDDIYCDAREVKYCGVCHNGEIAFPSTSRCNVCHIGVKGYNRVMGKTAGKGDDAGHH
jgi:c(7)-type cytochrome triheme protein